MHNLIQIGSVEHMARDPMSHAVISTDSNRITEYVNRKKYMEFSATLLQKQQDEIDSVKNDISEIKNMLVSMIQRQL